MTAPPERLAVRNLVSPYGLALFSSAIFLAAWITPPSAFMEFLGEPDVIYFNPLVLCFYGCCVLCFLAGAWAYQRFRRPEIVEERIDRSVPSATFLIVPLSVSTLLCAASVVVLSGKVSNLMGLLVSQQGALIKLANVSGQAEEGSWGYALTFHTGVLWWAYARARQSNLSGSIGWAFKIFFAVATVIGLLTALIKVDRTNLIPILSGLAIIYLYFRLSQKTASLRRVLMLSGGLVFLFMITFAGVSYIRGAGDARLLSIGIFGYTAASYNRLAAEVTGLLHYSFGGKGIYLSTFLSFNNTINRIIPFNELMGGATQRGVYFSEFSSIAAGGLNPGFNWPGAFGYIYADLGWWTPLYLFPIGLFNGYLWRSFRKETLIGIVFYPWAAFSILFWFGWNVLFDLRFALLGVVVVALSAYEYCFPGTYAYRPAPILRAST